MSTFVDAPVGCPHCHVEAIRSIAQGVNGGRSPKYRAAILADTFQRFTCDACGKPFSVDSPFLYTDFDRKQWIGLFPERAEANWKQLEEEPLKSFRRNMLENAPPVARDMADGFTVRAVFGLVALRDKLACLEAGLDDAVLEAFKLELMRAEERLELTAGSRPALKGVDGEGLEFSIRVKGPAGVGVETLRVPRARFEAFLADRAKWERAIAMVSAGPYVDVGRVLLRSA